MPQMKNTVVLDLFLGDSGKGKISDYLAQQSLGVIRFNGSNNAGHTLQVGGTKYKTHAVPSGVLYPHTVNYIGHGCVINPEVLLREIRTFEKINPAIYISGQAQIITPEHIQTDISREQVNGIGSTRQGVAPAYEDKMARRGLRYEDLLLGREEFREYIHTRFPLVGDSGYTFLRSRDLLNLYDKYSDELRYNIVKDSIGFIHDLAARGPLVFEGAQGCLLDVDVGPYPYVTSSNCTIGAVFTGTGLNPNQVQDIVGVIKSYGSYVGTNKNFDDIKDQTLNDRLSELGQEFGTTTGRRRRLCWLDLDQIKRAVMINGPTKLAITRMDTLGQMPKIYAKLNNQLIEFKPWGDLSNITSIKDLPLSAREYLDFIEKNLGVPIWAVGIGPERKDLLLADES